MTLPPADVGSGIMTAVADRRLESGMHAWTRAWEQAHIHIFRLPLPRALPLLRVSCFVELVSGGHHRIHSPALVYKIASNDAWLTGAPTRSHHGDRYEHPPTMANGHRS